MSNFRKETIPIIAEDDPFFKKEKCMCSDIAKQYHKNPFYYARAYCPTHCYQFKCRWLDKAKVYKEDKPHHYHIRLTFPDGASRRQLRDTFEEFIRILRKKDKNLIYFARIHYTKQAGLHLQMVIAIEKQLGEKEVQSEWAIAYYKKVDDYFLPSSYCKRMKETWLANVWYILGSSHPPDYMQLPPMGSFSHLVRCSKCFKIGTKKNKI